MIRRIGFVILGLASVILLVAVAAAWFVSRMDVRSRVESLASARLGRAVRIEPLAATIDAMISDTAAYAAHAAHHGPAPAS